MTVQIKQVESKSELKEFINLPWELYKNDPKWVPPLKMAVKEMLSPKHPFYKTSKMRSWIALKDGKTVGRISAVLNPVHNEFHGEECGFFGFYEAIDDEEVSTKLIETAESYLRENGVKLVRGPMNPSTNYECGMLVEGFDDPPQLMMSYNPTFYNDRLAAAGYTKAMDLLAYEYDLEKPLPPIIHKIADRVEKSSKITYRKVNKKKWAQEVEAMLEIYNSAWEKNWGFVPMSPEEFRHTANDLKMVVDENLMLFVEVAGKTAGFIVALPDYNQVFHKIPSGKLLPTGIFKLLSAKKHINRMRVITLGIKEEYRNLGLASLLYKQTQAEALKTGRYKIAECSWILENNKMMNKPLITMGAEVYKKYRIFEKELK